MGRRKTPPATVANGVTEDVAAAAVADAAARAAAVAAVAAAAAERRRLWFAAAKPPMYTVAVTPMLVGTAAAYAATGAYSPSRLGTLLAAAVAIIGWLNITNDVFDAATGIDAHKAESLVNLLGGTPRVRRRLLAVATGLLAAAGVALASLCVVPGGDGGGGSGDGGAANGAAGAPPPVPLRAWPRPLYGGDVRRAGDGATTCYRSVVAAPKRLADLFRGQPAVAGAPVGAPVAVRRDGDGAAAARAAATVVVVGRGAVGGGAGGRAAGRPGRRRLPAGD